MMPAWAKIWNLREIYEKIYEKKTSEADLGVVKDKGGGEQFLFRYAINAFYRY